MPSSCKRTRQERSLPTATSGSRAPNTASRPLTRTCTRCGVTTARRERIPRLARGARVAYAWNMSASAPGSPEFPPGSRLGRYEIVAPIAAGASGAVYRARDSETGTEVAVKRMLERAHRERFEIEIRLLSHLDHPRVVGILDHFTDHDDAAVIVMELVQGTDLARVLWDRGTPGLPIES